MDSSYGLYDIYDVKLGLHRYDVFKIIYIILNNNKVNNYKMQLKK
jgi:hypothetical protein